MTSKWLKRTAVLLSLCLTIGLTGCDMEGGSSDSSDVSDTSDSNEERHKIGYIFHESAENNGFSAQMNDQRVKAANRCSMDTCYIDNVSISDFETAVKTLVNEGCTDIISCSGIYANVLNSISEKYMNINFISYGATSGPANVSTYNEEPFQGAHVAGMVAAKNSNNRKIGFVGDSDMLYMIPSVNAAALGMQLVFSDADLFAAFATRDGEIKKAIDELISSGCDVIICYTESPYSADYCQQKGVKFIGSLDYSGKEDSYSNMLMYYCCKRDSYFLAQFKQMRLDSWQTGAYTGNMSNSIVSVSPALSSAANNGTQKIIDALVPKITSGDAQIFKGELKDNNDVIKYMQSDTMSDSEIYNMNWYVKGVTVAGNFREPQTDLPENKFEVKY